jgi:hypothetical protein
MQQKLLTLQEQQTCATSGAKITYPSILTRRVPLVEQKLLTIQE